MRELAQVNVAIMRAPLDDPSMAGFTTAFDAVARLAEQSPGFVWRLPAPSGHAVASDEDGADQVVNVSTWRDYQCLHQFVYRSNHGQLLLRRQRWFLPTRQPSTALWWLPAGERPSLDQALARLRYLRTYDERIELLTTHPAIADLDCIDTEHVAGKRDKHGVNTAEIAAVLGYLRSRIAAGARSIGVISPFRAQIDALEEVLLKQLSLDEITAGGIRVGTVHGVQGGEFDEVVISLALTDEDHASTWRFANDRNLLAVLTTRARQHVHVITSTRNPVGLIGEYLRHADIPPTETAGIAPTDDWTGRLAAALTELGRTVRTGYPLGQWRIDLVAGERESAVAVETRPHPDGPDAHLARWRALTHAGWQIHDAYPTRFDHDPIRAAMDLTPVSHPA